MFILEKDKWELITDSHVDLKNHCVTAAIKHFTKMGAGAPAKAAKPTGGDAFNDNSKSDDSSQYWFKANISYYSFKDIRLNDKDRDDRYTAGVAAYWDPVPYVQYYEMRYVFNNNPPPPDDSRKEGNIYIIGGDPEMKNFDLCG